MLTLTLLQIVERGFFDPIAVLFFLGAGAFLYATWFVLRRPPSDDDDFPRKNPPSSGAPSEAPRERGGKKGAPPK
jgi:hypothetical protein